jgi:hypothetical protein
MSHNKMVSVFNVSCLSMIFFSEQARCPGTVWSNLRTSVTVLLQSQDNYSYCIITVGENVLKVPLNILTLVERVVMELLRRL